MTQKIIKNKYLIFTLILAFFLRTFLLNLIPSGITNDELHFVLNAKSVFYRFTDMSGRWSPLSLTTIPEEASSELPFALISPLIGPLPLNLFTARLPFALFGVASIYLIYLITLRFTKSLHLSLFSALAASLNPWSIYVNRTSFDAPIAIFFFLLTIYLYSSKNPKSIYLSFVASLVGFYSYIGTKVIYLPFMLLLAIFFARKPNFKPYLTVSLLSAILMIFYFFKLASSTAFTRTSELITPFTPEIYYLTDLEKNQSLQSPFKLLFSNRYTVFLRFVTSKYLNNFSPDILFLTGDHTFLVSLWKHGYFYLLDLILLVAGSYYLFTRHRSLFYFLLCLILISPLPEAIRKDKIPAYAFHSAFQYPFLIILVGTGGYYLLQTLKNKYLKLGFITVYLLSFINFIDIYFFKYPIYQPEGFYSDRRIVSKFIHLEKTKSQFIYILTPEPDSLFRNYLFYTNSYSPTSFDKVKNIYLTSRDNIQWENLRFVKDPKDVVLTPQTTVIVDRRGFNNSYADSKLTISRLSDAGEMYSIFNSQTCHTETLGFFSHNLNFFDLGLENQSEPVFCQKFITQTF